MIWVEALKYPGEWDLMWAGLAADPVNDGQKDRPCSYDAETGETWQYMGSKVSISGFEILHSFRHRNHPATKAREYRTVKASEGFTLLAMRHPNEVGKY